MPFFQQAHPELSLFHLLSALEEPQHQAPKQCVRRQAPQQTFAPKFDITESAEAYELFGEVAGLEQQDLEIEFEDAQTLIIKGKVARGTKTATPAAPVEQEKEQEHEKESHNATVEDEYDEADAPLATPSSEGTVAEEKQSPAEERPAEKKFKYWVAERKVGAFARSFTFAQRIEHDSVQASLRNGVVHIVVPKSGKGKKVVVSVQ